jgi:hypothetical protein
MNISCVHREIPQDLTLAVDVTSHQPLPHMVVLTIKVWRTRTQFLVRHLWILDRLESRRSVIGSDTNCPEDRRRRSAVQKSPPAEKHHFCLNCLPNGSPGGCGLSAGHGLSASQARMVRG